MRKFLAYGLICIALLIGVSTVAYAAMTPADVSVGTIASHASEIALFAGLTVAAMTCAAVGTSILIDEGPPIRSSFYGMSILDAGSYPEDCTGPEFIPRIPSTAPA